MVQRVDCEPFLFRCCKRHVLKHGAHAEFPRAMIRTTASCIRLCGSCNTVGIVESACASYEEPAQQAQDPHRPLGGPLSPIVASQEPR